MATPLGIASVFGPILIIMGIWSLFYQANMRKVTESFKKNPATMYLGGLINLIIGLTIIKISPQWKFHMIVLVTILGWIMFLRGLFIFFLPNLIFKITKAQTNTYVFFGLLSIVWGFALCWLAFI